MQGLACRKRTLATARAAYAGSVKTICKGSVCWQCWLQHVESGATGARSWQTVTCGIALGVSAGCAGRARRCGGRTAAPRLGHRPESRAGLGLHVGLKSGCHVYALYIKFKCLEPIFVTELGTNNSFVKGPAVIAVGPSASTCTVLLSRAGSCQDCRTLVSCSHLARSSCLSFSCKKVPSV